MAQLLVRNLDESVKRRLKQRAAKNGRSLEGEVREILSATVKTERDKPVQLQEKGVGTRLTEIFAGKVPEDFQIPAFRSEPWRTVDLDE
jgi:plasmid stability protein